MSLMGGNELHRHFTRGRSMLLEDGRAAAHEIYPISVHKDIKLLYEALQLCKITLMQNGELVVVPNGAECGDVVCIPEEGVAPFLLRPRKDECWSLVSGDCYIFNDRLHGEYELTIYFKTTRKQRETFTLR